ncbi:amidase [Edaphobacter flagellatus]|uniref:amidase n=1 Tax=Edaphobacter flagellatus TaxID=1933044 RepID=UPI0021B471A1|nr:amidase [Edaphobacter flagellatus]
MKRVSPAYSLKAYREALDEGRVTSRELVEACLEAALDREGEGAHVFTKVFESTARAEAEAADYLPVSAGLPLRGVPVTVKDLFDVEGQVTRAGSVVLNDAPPAASDAAVVRRLRDAGAVVVGRTNMTEFAFSGLGLNPHYGTPRTPYAREEGRISGGSSSGSAVSVSDGMAVAAVGSDTGGSIRIPAALCGLTGFKPTARRVSMQGVLPLSPSLDSIGPIAATVACCAAMDEVLSGETHALQQEDAAGLRLGVLQGYVLDGLESHVATSFDAALDALSHAGVKVSAVRFDALDEIPQCYRYGGIAAAESYAWHRELIARAGDRYDPRVLTRIVRGGEISDSEYRDLLDARRRIIAGAEKVFAMVDAWVMPTVPRVAPLVAELERSDEAYFDANGAMLRNTLVFNFLDACSLSMPCHRQGEAPVGLMLSARGDDDARLLQVSLAVERVLAEAGFAIQGQVSF